MEFEIVEIIGAIIVLSVQGLFLAFKSFFKVIKGKNVSKENLEKRKEKLNSKLDKLIDEINVLYGDKNE